VATECLRIVPFSLFSITLFSEDGEHAQLFYVYPALQYQLSARWTAMSNYAKKFVETQQIMNIPDLPAFFDLDDWRVYRDDPDVRAFLDAGIHSSVSYPVKAGNRVVATVSFSRTRDQGSFSQQDQGRLGCLPLDAAVSMALHYQKVGDLSFVLDLIRQIQAASTSPERTAAILIEEIARHFEWENVSIFQADEQQGRLCLVAQQAKKESFRLPKNWCHTIDEGVTGQVYRTGETLNVRDVKDSKWGGIVLQQCPEARSELCIPIIVSGRVYWVLDIVDSKRNAFVMEEQSALENIIREVALVLHLAVQTQIFSELLKRSKDAVIQTDFLGIIKQTNPATEELLGYSEAELNGTPFARYFKDQEQARRVAESSCVPNDEVQLLSKDGLPVSLLLSGTSLPQEFGLKVYVCNDLSARKRMETLEILRHMFNELASQVKTPLSLAFTWLGRLQKTESRPDAADVLAKTLKQLNKVDLSYDRLLFYERYKTIAPLEKTVFALPVLVETIRQEMPDEVAAQIEVTAQPDLSLVVADIFQIGFCVESVLAYLLRFVPDSGQVKVSMAARDGGVAVVICGYAPPVTGGAVKNYAATLWAIHAITEMAVGEEMIRNFIEVNHAGAFHKRMIDANLMEYVIVLPGI
jgi:PAS domain S-box-containing protein